MNDLKFTTAADFMSMSGTDEPEKTVSELLREGFEEEQQEHDNCGTPDCCGDCEAANRDDNQDEEFEKHCMDFFKGRAL